MKKKNKHIGSTLDSYLAEKGLLEHTEAVAIKRTVAYQLKLYLEQEGITQAELARRMKTSKAAVNRLLNPNNPSITLHSLISAAQANCTLKYQRFCDKFI